jgi:DNA polymerase-3 subunit delta
MAAPKNSVSFENILLDLKNRIYSPVYFLFGEEAYFIDVISDYIEENVLSETEKEFNQMVIYGKDSDPATIASYARRFPMMSNYPMESTLLVLCYKYEKIDRRKTFCKSIEKKGVLFESARIYDNKIPDWIAEYVRKQNYTISTKACFLLAEFLGNDISKIVNEISKLVINVPEKEEITEEYVEKNIGISKDYNVFELQKALGRKEVLKANRIITYFAANPRENPLVKVIPLLFSFFSKLLVYHHLEDKSRNNVAAALSINPFFVADYQQAAANYSSARLVGIISLLREFDLKSKGVDSNATSFPDGELMKELIFRILH